MNNIAINNIYSNKKKKPTVYYKESIQEYQRISENIKEYREFVLSQITGSINITSHSWLTDTIYTSSSHSIKQFLKKMISYGLEL